MILLVPLPQQCRFSELTDKFSVEFVIPDPEGKAS